MTDPNDDLQGWMTAWHQADASPPARDALRRYVRRRSTVLMAWVVAETAIALVGLVVLGYLGLTRPDRIERVVMSTLALACAAALMFGWWNWRGSLRAIGETTAVYLDLSRTRLVRLRRGLLAGWLLLAVEMGALTPWVWHRTRAASTTAMWPWILLVTLCVLAIAWLIGVGRWVRREQLIVEDLRREHADME